MVAREFIISTLVRSISAGPEDAGWLEVDGGEVATGDKPERAVDARVLTQFIA
jgi:hypothetical protein